MNKRKMKRFISDYLDGESRKPEKVEQLLNQDREASEYYQDLLQLRESLRSLKAPTVNPDFTTKVLARIAQANTERVRPRWLWVGLPVAAAALLVIISSVYFATYRSISESHPETHLANAIDEDTISNIIEAKVASGAEIPITDIAFTTLEETAFAEESEETPYESQVLEDMLAAIDSESDLTTVLESLQNGEAVAFRSLLAEYVLEG